MPMDKLPQLVGSGWQVGAIDKYAHERTGLPIGMPICTGGGDQQCAAIGAGVIDEGLCEVTFGTAGVSVAHLNSPKYDPNHGRQPVGACVPGEDLGSRGHPGGSRRQPIAGSVTTSGTWSSDRALHQDRSLT